MIMPRFGAILLGNDNAVGFYLSYRVVLTVPHRGRVRAVSSDDFAPNRIFACAGAASPFFDAMLKAAIARRQFGSGLEMLNFFLALPEKTDIEHLFDYMKRQYGVSPVAYVPHKTQKKQEKRKWKTS